MMVFVLVGVFGVTIGFTKRHRLGGILLIFTAVTTPLFAAFNSSDGVVLPLVILGPIWASQLYSARVCLWISSMILGSCALIYMATSTATVWDIMVLVALLAGVVSWTTTRTPNKNHTWIDEDAFFEHIGKDLNLLHELKTVVVAENDRRMRALREALANQDANRVREEAHGIKSGLTNLCAPKAVTIAHELEFIAQTGVLDGLETSVNALDQCLSQITQQLHDMGKAA